MGSEEDTYTSIFNALRHPIRRRILRMLEEKPSTYTEVLSGLGIDNGLLNYHLDSLRELVTKGGDDRYTLSDYGRATLSINRRIEDPPGGAAERRWPTSPVLLALIVVLLVASVASTALYLDLNGRYGALGSRYEEQGQELEALQSKFRNLAGAPGIVNLTLSEPSSASGIGIHVVSGYYLTDTRILKTFFKGEENHTQYVSEGDTIAFIYAPEDDLTLEITAMLQAYEEKSIPLTVQAGSPLEPRSVITSEVELPIVWAEELEDYGLYEVRLPTRGWYTLHTQGPISVSAGGGWTYLNAPEFEYNLRILFRMTRGGSSMLFAVRPLSR
jgi:hypothetical protein